MTSGDEELLNGITALTPRLLNAMGAFEQVQRNLHPGRIGRLAEFIRPFAADLQSACDAFAGLTFPGHLGKFGAQLGQAAAYSLSACNGIAGGDTGAVMKAMRAQCRAQEKLYPVAGILRPVSQYFLELPKRRDNALLDALDKDRPGQRVGIMHAANDRRERGGFTLYAPEYTDPARPSALIVALHGGTGHGADFLWAWLREARTRGFLLLSPTSQQDTWSLAGEEHDLPLLLQTLEFVAGHFALDREHILLTGMSDGATYTLLAGLREDSPFTHLAPFSGVLHPDLAGSGAMAHARGRNIYLVHGVDDWMFPIETACMARSELEAAGANLTFRPIDGLSHTYARTENDALLNWFNPALRLG